MGIIINDTLTLETGQTATNTYCSIAPNYIACEKNTDGTFTIRGRGTIWVDQNAKDEGKNSISSQGIYISISSSNLDSNLYTQLYTQLKTNYTSTTDVL